ncbi:MAG: cell surface protein [Sphingomonas taxi]|uniref:Cell surface protein n=1 Tax=Sphingomonas taxi TaxID=1549858 RepID=A0A2W5QXF0_9SPHN|nr:MAG: cell surface protein [Sphingomonas taxi]
MTDMPLRRRKRSAAAGLSAAGALAMLSGCDASPDDQQRFGPPTEVSAFKTVDECVASGAFAKVTCEDAAKAAAGEDGKAAPRFDSQNLCEDQFGSGQCLARNEGGQSFFVPLLTGFMIGRMLDGGGGYRYNGLYRSRRDNSWYTPSGAWLYNGGYGGRGYRYQVGSRAITTPVTTQRIQTRSSVVSRGGFGGRVSARSSGGWGGGRSFGG